MTNYLISIIEPDTGFKYDFMLTKEELFNLYNFLEIKKIDLPSINRGAIISSENKQIVLIKFNHCKRCSCNLTSIKDAIMNTLKMNGY